MRKNEGRIKRMKRKRMKGENEEDTHRRIAGARLLRVGLLPSDPAAVDESRLGQAQRLTVSHW
jgi:hypothetical protein